MKQIKLIYCIAFLALLATGCEKKDGIDQDLSFLSSANSSALAKIFEISNDNSGNVKITPTGEGVSSFVVNYGHGTGSSASATVEPGNNTTHSYPEGSYTVTIVSYDIAGKSTSTTYPLTLTYRAPENLTVNIGSDAKISATALYAKSFLVYYGCLLYTSRCV